MWLAREVVTTPQNGVFNNEVFPLLVLGGCCDNPSKWGLQQPKILRIFFGCCCDNPSKWGLQQRRFSDRIPHGGCDNPSKWDLQQQQRFR